VRGAVCAPAEVNGRIDPFEGVLSVIAWLHQQCLGSPKLPLSGVSYGETSNMVPHPPWHDVPVPPHWVVL
jgi:hypothetical protein